MNSQVKMAVDRKLNRRDFLKLGVKAFALLSAVLGLGELWEFIAHQSETVQPNEFNLGPAANYPPGSRTVIPDANSILIHATDGFHAISLICTHLGCTVKAVEGGFACPCHNSRFDLEGNVVHGPAAKPLPKWKITQTKDGRLILSKP
jgi:cytochrome b6-f complex iron-sulfur subunit